MEPGLRAILDFTTEIHKQMLTLATGVFALTVTFFGSHIGFLVYIAWAVLVFSILAGITGLGAVKKGAEKQTKPHQIYGIFPKLEFFDKDYSYL